MTSGKQYLTLSVIFKPYVLIFLLSNISYVQFYSNPTSQQITMPKMANEFADLHSITDETIHEPLSPPTNKGYSITSRHRRSLRFWLTKI
jgi:hypothetical protein